MPIFSPDWAGWLLLAQGEQADSANLGNYVIMLIAGVALVFVILTMRGRRMAGPDNPRDFAQQQIDRLRTTLRDEGAAKSGSAAATMAQAQRDITGQIDSKLRQLEAVISDADTRIARLTELLELYDRKSISPGRGGNALVEIISALAEAGRSPDQIAQQLGRSLEEVRTILAAEHGADTDAPPQ